MSIKKYLKLEKNKKAGALLYSIVIVFLVFSLAIVVYFTVENMSFDRIVGDDATKITEIKQMGYKQRFFIESVSSKIIKDSEANFENYADKTFPKYDDKILLKNSTYELHIRQEAENYLQNNFNAEFAKYINLYNEEIKGSQLEIPKEKNKNKEKVNSTLSYLQYTLYSDQMHTNKMYGISSQQQKITFSKKIGGIWYEDIYYYWPHFTIESDMLYQLSTIDTIKEYYLECKITTKEILECVTKAKNEFSDKSKYAEDIQASEDFLSIGQYIFVFKK